MALDCSESISVSINNEGENTVQNWQLRHWYSYEIRVLPSCCLFCIAIQNVDEKHSMASKSEAADKAASARERVIFF